MNRRATVPVRVGAAIVLAFLALGVGTYAVLESHAPAPPTSATVRVVAAENFWGSLVAQLGGSRVSVTSIVSDPNADPHEYEANASVARLVADAQLVVENGDGYDDWCSHLIDASPSAARVVLNVQETLGVASGTNPHFWYYPADVNRTVREIFADLVALSPSDRSYFQSEYGTLNISIDHLYGRAAGIRAQFSGTPVASTEDIFVGLANFTGLDLVSPPEFMSAVSEGNDPPAASVVAFEQQLEGGTVRVLVYNSQTVSPITSEMEQIAIDHNVTVVAVSETIQPPGGVFQTWMDAEFVALEAALLQGAGTG